MITMKFIANTNTLLMLAMIGCLVSCNPDDPSGLASGTML